MQGHVYSYYFEPGMRTYSRCNVGPGVPDGYICFGDGAAVDWTQYEYDGQSLVKKPVVEQPVIPAPDTKLTKADRLRMLDAEYQPQFVDLARSWAMADTDGDTAEMAAIKTDRANLKAEYTKKRGEIENGN